MKAIFNLVQIHAVLAALRTYDTLFVTTEGQMFQKEESCIESVRTKNAILDDPEQYVAFVKLSKDCFSNEDILAIFKAKKVDANSETLFEKAFSDAKIPRQREESSQQQHERKFEKQGASKAAVNELDKLLEEASKPAPQPAQQVAQPTAAKTAATTASPTIAVAQEVKK